MPVCPALSRISRHTISGGSEWSSCRIGGRRGGKQEDSDWPWPSRLRRSRPKAGRPQVVRFCAGDVATFFPVYRPIQATTPQEDVVEVGKGLWGADAAGGGEDEGKVLRGRCRTGRLSRAASEVLGALLSVAGGKDGGGVGGGGGSGGAVEDHGAAKAAIRTLTDRGVLSKVVDCRNAVEL